jgi:hypothetical protein
MVAQSDGERHRLPERIDPSLKKKRTGRWKPIEYLRVPNDAESKLGEQELRSKTTLSGSLSDCWVCVSHAKNANGYILYYTKDANGKHKGTTLHRVIYELAMGKALPPDLFACHRCDVPWCINPSHIFPGTSQDNQADMVVKGRNEALHGENHWNSKLTEAQVWEARLKYMRGGVTQKKLADDYGVSMETMNSAIHCKTWRRR